MVRNPCPLCADAHETDADLRVHLEVEHRKSELASHIVTRSDRTDAAESGGEPVPDDPPTPVP